MSLAEQPVMPVFKDDNTLVPQYLSKGISLRQYYAGLALQGLAEAYATQSVDDYQAQFVAQDCVKLADASHSGVIEMSLLSVLCRFLGHGKWKYATHGKVRVSRRCARCGKVLPVKHRKGFDVDKFVALVNESVDNGK